MKMTGIISIFMAIFSLRGTVMADTIHCLWSTFGSNEMPKEPTLARIKNSMTQLSQSGRQRHLSPHRLCFILLNCQPDSEPYNVVPSDQPMIVRPDPDDEERPESK